MGKRRRVNIVGCDSDCTYLGVRMYMCKMVSDMLNVDMSVLANVHDDMC